MTTRPTNPPAVSVVIIFLDAGAFLAEAIASVRAQTATDWELILVDDGSTDGSSAVATEAAASDPGRIRTLEHPGHINLGTSASRELGLRTARGDTVLYLDSDDILFVDALETLRAALEREPGADAALAETLFWNWHALFRDRADARQDLGPWRGAHRAPKLLTALTLDEYIHPANCSSLFRRQALLDVGGFEAAFTGMYEDTVLLAKVLLERRVVLLDRCVSAYRMHPASQCHRAAASGTYDAQRPNPDRARYLRWLRLHVRARRVRGAALRLAIERELFRFEHPLVNRLARTVRGSVRRAGRGAAARLRRRPDAAPATVPQRNEIRTTEAVESLARALAASGMPGEADALRRRLAARRPA